MLSLSNVDNTECITIFAIHLLLHVSVTYNKNHYTSLWQESDHGSDSEWCCMHAAAWDIDGSSSRKPVHTYFFSFCSLRIKLTQCYLMPGLYNCILLVLSVA